MFFKKKYLDRQKLNDQAEKLNFWDFFYFTCLLYLYLNWFVTDLTGGGNPPKSKEEAIERRRRQKIALQIVRIYVYIYIYIYI